MVLIVGVGLLPMTVKAFAMLPAASATTPDTGGAVYAVEFARLPGDVDAAPGLSLAHGLERFEQMRSGTQFDMVYAHYYAAFLALWCIAAGSGRWLEMVAGVVLAVAAGWLDVRENLAILAILEGWPAEVPAYGSLRMYATAKFAAIAGVLAVAGSLLLGRATYSRARLAIAVVLFVCAGLVGANLATPQPTGTVLGNAIGAGWVLMLGYAGVQAWRGTARAGG